MNRRSFFQITAVAVGALVGYSTLARAEERRRSGGASAAGGTASAAVLVDPKDQGAKAVNYVSNGSEVKDAKLTIERTGVKFKDQRCKGCAFYQKDKETKLDGKAVAPCMMPFSTGKVVSAEGWCTSWAKKA